MVGSLNRALGCGIIILLVAVPIVLAAIIITAKPIGYDEWADLRCSEWSGVYGMCGPLVYAPIVDALKVLFGPSCWLAFGGSIFVALKITEDSTGD
jgi:hypothetical protein